MVVTSPVHDSIPKDRLIRRVLLFHNAKRGEVIISDNYGFVIVVFELVTYRGELAVCLLSIP